MNKKTVFLLMIFFMVASGPAEAHSVKVLAHVQAGTCYVQGYLSGSRPAKNAKVEVFDPEENKLIEGITDGEGKFAFGLPQKNGDLKIVLTAGMGHRGEFVVRSEERTKAMNENTPIPAAHPVPPVRAEPPRQGPVLVDPAALQEMLDHAVDQALEERLKPLYTLIAETHKTQGIAFKDVLAGFGYIVGIFGLAAWVASRKKDRGQRTEDRGRTTDD